MKSLHLPTITSAYCGLAWVVMMSAAHVGDGDELFISKYDRKMRGTYWYSSSSSSIGVTKSVTKTLHLVGLGLVFSSHMAASAYLVVVKDNDIVSRLDSSLRTRMSLNCGSALSLCKRRESDIRENSKICWEQGRMSDQIRRGDHDFWSRQLQHTGLM